MSTSLYSVVYQDESGAVESVAARGMNWTLADVVLSHLQPRAREGMRFKVVLDREAP